MKPKRFDEKFDRGEDVTGEMDTGKARPVRHEQKRLNVDLPVWMIEALDRGAARGRDASAHYQDVAGWAPGAD